MRVWLVHQYALPPDETGPGRLFHLARELARRGCEISVIAGSFNHHTRQPLHRVGGAECSSEAVDGVRFHWIRTPAYAGNTVARVLSMIRFSVGVLRWARTVRERPDVIIGSSPHLFGALVAQRLAARFGVPFVLEVRDLWPESIIELGKISRRNPLIVLFHWIERHVYNRAALVVSVLPKARAYLVGRGVADSVIVDVPNGVDGKLLSSAAGNSTDRPAFEILYAGSHGVANALHIVLEAAALLQARPSAAAIRFRFLGDGAEKENLVAHAASLGLRNVRFEEPLPRNRMPREIAMADACILAARPLPLYRWGFSPNKLFEYLALARPVVFVMDPVHNCFDRCEAVLPVRYDANDIADEVERLAATPRAELKRRGETGREYVRSHHTYETLGARLFEALRSVVPPTATSMTASAEAK